MRANKMIIFAGVVMFLVPALTGCVSSRKAVMDIYPIPLSEAEWIRNGEPIEYDGAKWYPRRSYEVLLDSEMDLKGEYQGVQFFIEKLDVRPYNRLYTKFGHNKFRLFTQKR